MMSEEFFEIRQADRLSGSLAISGSKNTALPVLAATLLTSQSSIRNVPMLQDVRVLLELLATLGARVFFEGPGHIGVDASSLNGEEAPYALLRQMRAAFLVLGPLLARLGKARVALPGGCAIGSRPVDLHLKVLEALGAELSLEHGMVVASAPKGLRGAEFRFDFVSVGATENAMMAAVCAEGSTILHHVSAEPEVIALAEALNAAGARIQGHGSDTLVIEGVDALGPLHYEIIPDRLEAGTFLIAATMVGGDITLTDVQPAHLDALLSLLRSCGAEIEEGPCSLRLRMQGRPGPFELVTEVYPGFPTDLQAQMLALACVADGQSVIQERIFENRMMHVPELIRMGANVRLLGNTAIISGQPHLQGAEVAAPDLRAAAALILAGLVSAGPTRVQKLHHVRRGYVAFDERLRSLGAHVYRGRF